MKCNAVALAVRPGLNVSVLDHLEVQCVRLQGARMLVPLELVLAGCLAAPINDVVLPRAGPGAMMIWSAAAWDRTVNLTR